MSEKRNDGPLNKAKNKPQIIDVEATAASSDERKTVILDSQLEDLDFDDRIWLFWSRNKTTLIASFAAVFVIVAAWGLVKHFIEQNKQSLADAYAAAATFEQKEAFAGQNMGTIPAGIALLDNADSLYAEGKFADAANLYKGAATTLDGSMLYGRALLGEGISLIKADKGAEGAELLKKLAADSKGDVYSAEANVHLGVLAFDAGKFDEAKARFALAQSSTIWGEFVQKYLDKIPATEADAK